MMLSAEIVEKLRERYKQIHPLLFQRSVEKAKNDVDLFDILDTIPDSCPIVWSHRDRKWVHTKDLLLSMRFDIKEIEK